MATRIHCALRSEDKSSSTSQDSATQIVLVKQRSNKKDLQSKDRVEIIYCKELEFL